MIVILFALVSVDVSINAFRETTLFSPPIANPCNKREPTKRIGAQTPICAAVGISPIATVAKPMMSIVTRKVLRLPQISPRRPNTKAPSGRTAKPAANASRAKM